jgi:flagellar biosynthetic protein FliR
VPNIFALHEKEILIFALLTIRMMAFIFSSAIFGQSNVNMQMKVLFSLSLSFVFFPFAHKYALAYQEDVLILHVIREVAVGLVLGFATKIFFLTVSMVGELLSSQVGLSSSQLLNPALGSHSTSMEQFYVLIASILFLYLNGHHVFIIGINESVKVIPIGGLTFKTGSLAETAMLGSKLLEMAVRFCAPVLVTTLIANIAMAIVSRAVPQINVLVTSMPVTIMLGLGVMIITMPLIVQSMGQLMDFSQIQLFKLMRGL